MVELRNIHLSFDDTVLFDGFNLKVQQREKVLIYGKSGIGKSSIMKMILGFVEPDKGNVLYKGKELDKNTVWGLRENTAFVTQDNDITGGLVKDFISEVMGYKANKNIEISKDKIVELLEYFDLESKILEKDFQDLSGGEKQRISIIVSILLDKELYLLDEITSSLDNKMKKKVVDYFVDEMDKTQIIISHDNHWLEKDKLRIINLEEL
ncbi:ABC transporter ATP-binding protein [Geotoga petraea]|uniref:Putative ABC transport system ATP-binding protein n=1 Tax=Geotoga petraea TaxID=28234 RepID=A0A1G6KN36_9BACT|nr:ATP-binding cassette domain-containing protein [Geotoga petraea]SDC32238.1 putative ABC transport system ATP-binding protein [Geotoga petraea]